MIEHPTKLYRGFDPNRFDDTRGGLRPKAPGQPFKYVFKAGEIINNQSGRILRAGDGAVVGGTAINAVFRHQSDPDLGWRDCGISTTPYASRAKHYALHGGTRERGTVLVIDTTSLSEWAVRYYRVADLVVSPSLPEDDEYILVADDYGVLPEGIVRDRYDV